MSSKAAVWALGCLGLLAAARVGWAQATPPEVAIRKLAFAPATLSVPAGSTVTFKNGDDMVHSVVASDGSFRTGAIAPGGSAGVTLKKPGTYSYFCGVHPFMEGRLVVTGARAGGLVTNDR